MEPYLTLQNRKLVKLISRFRSGAHKLRIHTGRYEIPGGLLITDRTCIYCNSNEIDDENHFITSCQFHSCERNTLFTNVGAVLPNFLSMTAYEKFIYLLQTKDMNVLTYFGKYLENCFESRSRVDTARQV